MNEQPYIACPKCGEPIGDDAPQGLCPKCVLAEVATVPYAEDGPTGRTPPPTVEELAPHFPWLEIQERIGAGGMAAVYKARQPNLDRFVALKILSAELAEDPAFVERFNREARVLARLGHPNIVAVYDFGTEGPYCYLLMEYVDGVNLREAMQTGGFAPADSLTLVRDICTALEFAHAEGVLHRDIKPENVLLDTRGRVKIADFGLAKLVNPGGHDKISLTGKGTVLGTLHYMAPEQWETPDDVDQRADVYSLGVVFYELLTGELPVGRFGPPSESRPIDPQLDEIVMRALERKRERRYQSAGEVRTSVEGVSSPDAGVTPRNGPPSPDLPTGDAKFALPSAVVATLPAFVGPPLAVLLSAVGFGALELLVLGLLFVFPPGVVGTILGGLALREIRESGGRKGGFVPAVFGALTWPAIVVLLTVTVLPTAFLPGSTDTSFLALYVLGCFAGAVVSIVCAVRAVWLWTYRHNGAGLMLAGALATIFAVPAAAFATAIGLFTLDNAL